MHAGEGGSSENKHFSIYVQKCVREVVWFLLGLLADGSQKIPLPEEIISGETDILRNTGHNQK